jgi:hypothetical protein
MKKDLGVVAGAMLAAWAGNNVGRRTRVGIVG